MEGKLWRKSDHIRSSKLFVERVKTRSQTDRAMLTSLEARIKQQMTDMREELSQTPGPGEYELD